MCTSLLLALIMSSIFAIQCAPVKRESNQQNKMGQNKRLTCLYCAADCIKVSIQKLVEVRNKTYTACCGYT